MIYLIIVLIVVLVVYLVILAFVLAENSGILDEQILQDYLDKLSNNYKVDISEYYERIKPNYSTSLGTYITRSPSIIRLIFPYHIEYIGLIPVWSKSKPRIDAMFATGIKSDWKRKKLGLD